MRKPEIDESMLEVIKLLQEKNRKKHEKKARAKASQEAFTENATRFIENTLAILTPLTPYGITCIKERKDISRDFGEGEITIELERLIIKESDDTIVTLEPFSSDIYGSDALRFRATFPKTGNHTILQNPPPFGQHMGWHMWMNEDDRSVDPKYQSMDKDGWITIIKNHLLDNINS